MYHSDDVQQMKWDSILINGWSKDSRMGYLLDKFMAAVPDADLRLVRRFPRKWELSMVAKVFVARYIPKLSARLFDHPKDASYWLMLNGDRVKRLPTKNGADKAKLAADVAEIRSSMRLDKRLHRLSNKDGAKYDSHKLSYQWKVCK